MKWYRTLENNEYGIAHLKVDLMMMNVIYEINNEYNVKWVLSLHSREYKYTLITMSIFFWRKEDGMV